MTSATASDEDKPTALDLVEWLRGWARFECERGNKENSDRFYLCANGLRRLAAFVATPQDQTAQPVAQWGDPRVQIVYDILCDDARPTDSAEHWEGFVARRIVDALYLTGRGDNSRREAESSDQVSATSRGQATSSAFTAPPTPQQTAQPVAWMYEHAERRSCPSLERWAYKGDWTETPLYAAPAVQPIPLTDAQIINAAYRADEETDGVTRVSEMRPEGWHATTIFDGDKALIAFAQSLHDAFTKSKP